MLFAVSFLFGLVFIISGLNKFFNHMPLPEGKLLFPLGLGVRCADHYRDDRNYLIAHCEYAFGLSNGAGVIGN